MTNLFSIFWLNRFSFLVDPIRKKCFLLSFLFPIGILFRGQIELPTRSKCLCQVHSNDSIQFIKVWCHLREACTHCNWMHHILMAKASVSRATEILIIIWESMNLTPKPNVLCSFTSTTPIILARNSEYWFTCIVCGVYVSWSYDSGAKYKQFLPENRLWVNTVQ